MELYRIRANLFRLGDKETITCIFIDKYLGGGRSAVALIRGLWIVGLSLVALALDLLVCGIGAAFCGVCAVRDEVLSFA